jgi:hypothetical protein
MAVHRFRIYDVAVGQLHWIKHNTYLRATDEGKEPNNKSFIHTQEVPRYGISTNALRIFELRFCVWLRHEIAIYESQPNKGACGQDSVCWTTESNIELSLSRT